MNLVLSIPRRLPRTEVVNLSDLSCLYQSTRDASGEGASTFPTGKVFQRRGKSLVPVGRVSYNGRVWDNGQDIGRGEDRLLYDPSGTMACADAATAFDIAAAAATR